METPDQIKVELENVRELKRLAEERMGNLENRMVEVNTQITLYNGIEESYKRMLEAHNSFQHAIETVTP
jgi:hypothetical protein